MSIQLILMSIILNLYNKINNRLYSIIYFSFVFFIKSLY
ncbi:hypothetical protein CLO_3055 [Clostridium botulinum E1 str. 'BoNT E Beluga']|nr:hypothetical protein CLO_3055 [Clostridium botulinum E1 str. 'BoNT E Beluga']